MPLSETEHLPGDIRLAVTAEIMYLVNLLLLPGVAFVVLFWVYVRRRESAGKLAVSHLQQCVAASLWAGGLLAGVTGLVLVTGDYRQPEFWVFLVIYFTTCHAALVLLGVLGLVKAMAGQYFRYPLIGPPLPG